VPKSDEFWLIWFTRLVHNGIESHSCWSSSRFLSITCSLQLCLGAHLSLVCNEHGLAHFLAPVVSCHSLMILTNELEKHIAFRIAKKMQRIGIPTCTVNAETSPEALRCNLRSHPPFPSTLVSSFSPIFLSKNTTPYCDRV